VLTDSELEKNRMTVCGEKIILFKFYTQ